MPRKSNPDLARSRDILRDQSRNKLTRSYEIEQQQPATHYACTLDARTTFQDKLEEALRACKRPFLRVSTSTVRLESLIKKEMDLYECGGTSGQFFKFAYNSLLTLVPTSVESERAFLAAEYIATELRCRLSDSTISRYYLFFKELFPKSPLELNF